MIKLKALIEVVRDKVPTEGECAGWWQNHESEEGEVLKESFKDVKGYPDKLTDRGTTRCCPLPRL